jgi:hypothetical protein
METSHECVVAAVKQLVVFWEYYPELQEVASMGSLGTGLFIVGGRVWSSGGYTSQRMRLYKKEGIEVNEKGYIQNFITILYGF